MAQHHGQKLQAFNYIRPGDLKDCTAQELERYNLLLASMNDDTTRSIYRCLNAHRGQCSIEELQQTVPPSKLFPAIKKMKDRKLVVQTLNTIAFATTFLEEMRIGYVQHMLRAFFLSVPFSSYSSNTPRAIS